MSSEEDRFRMVISRYINGNTRGAHAAFTLAIRAAEDAARADEREACAKLCDTDFAKQTKVAGLKEDDGLPGSAAMHGCRASWARWVAAAIRARGES